MSFAPCPLALLVLAAVPLAQRTPVDPAPGLTPGGPRPGDVLAKPGGGFFVLDPHLGGRRAALHLEASVSGRLVDVHGLDAGGALVLTPLFRDFLVGETIQSDGSDYQLVSSPSTQVARLIVLRQPGAPEPSPGAGTFEQLLRRAEDAAQTLPPKALFAALVPAVPRNGALALRFDDLLEDGASARAALATMVQLRFGAGLATPFPARVLFDEHHGGITQGAFHPTRVLVDFTVSAFEAGESATPLPIDALGVPGAPGTAANLALRLPTQLDPGGGQFARLENLSGKPLARNENGPVDLGSPTVDVVRGLRGAAADAANAGVLLDLLAPGVLGQKAVQVTQAVADPAGEAGFAFRADWVFTAGCAARSLIGDALEIGGRTFEVVAPGPAPDALGGVQGVRVRLAQRTPVVAGALLGNGTLVVQLRAAATTSACWFGILPTPLAPPGSGVATSAGFALRFSEPMRLDSLDPYHAFRLVAGALGLAPDSANSPLVDLGAAAGLDRFRLQPVLPLAHVQGQASVYHLEVLAGADGPLDLAGNALTLGARAELRIDPAQASETSGALLLRLAALDEAPGIGPDLRGQFFFDFDAKGIRGRPPFFFQAPADRTRPVPSIMIPFPPGVSGPLTPLGAKMHSIWRYCDLGWRVGDETKVNVDVVGLNWSPAGGVVVSDFYPQFELRLAHGRRLPDEAIDGNLLPRYPSSGLVSGPAPFSDNVLADPLSPQKVVHPRALGYAVSAADVFVSTTGTPLLPYPLNRGGGPLVTYTWRDTAALSKGGPGAVGVPLDIEVGPPLFLEPQVGALAPAGAVPTVGLPLLLEVRCYPSAVGLGLNRFDVSLAINSSARPAFRSYSAGGINTQGQPVVLDPDLADVPAGGFNPSSTPPGRPTSSADNVFFLGQVDLVYRVSRVHSSWFDSASDTPTYLALRTAAMPSGSGGFLGVGVELRGASGFSGTGGAEGDARNLDAYGDLATGTVAFLAGDSGWHGNPGAIDGARFFQLRVTLLNDLEAGTSPSLDLLGLAFRR